jgi:ribosomal-protein-alanine N-acetyltransferase
MSDDIHRNDLIDRQDMPKAETLAALHATAFDGPARWSEAAFSAALTDPICFLTAEGSDPLGFVLGRAIAGEAELLTLVVSSEHRRAGLGARLLAAFEAEAARRGTGSAFLEVSADNEPARRLYERAGWRVVGGRKGYYEGIDAVSMRKRL